MAARGARAGSHEPRAGLSWFLCPEGAYVMDLDATLRESIARICGVPADQVSPGSTLEDLGIDSLTAAEIITDVEIQAGIELPMDVLRGLGKMQTVGEVVAHLQAGALSLEAPSEP